MARRPLTKNLWERHEALYVDIFSKALLKLTTKNNIQNDEPAISEVLNLQLREICCEIARTEKKEIPTPIWEGPITPVIEEELRGGRRIKRPDFTCKCINIWAEPEFYEISFHVECKRLGNSSPQLNEKYVTEGIKRFDSLEHGYGKRAESGLMIGYITSTEPEKIMADVNEYQAKYLPNHEILYFADHDHPIYNSRQNLNRKNVNPNKFKLIHIWIDLRFSMAC
jgi:hypothetical protein